MLYFTASIIALCANCVCWRIGGVNFQMEEDAKSRLAVQRGAVNANDASVNSSINSNDMVGTAGFYSKRVRRLRGSVLTLFAVASLIDVAKLYFQSKAVESDLQKCYGNEYTTWYDTVIQGMTMEDAMANRQNHRLL